MTPAGAALLVAAALLPCSGSGSAHAGGGADATGLTVSAEMRVGAVTAPFYTEALAEIESELTQARSMILTAALDVTPRFTAGARWPAAPSLVKQPAGSYVDQKAFASPELWVEDRSLRWRRGAAAGYARLRVALGIPLAQHGPAATLARNQTLAISDALDGWRNPELYTPGVVPLTPSAQSGLASGRWRLDARIKLPVLVRIDDADLPDEARTRAVGFVPHLEVRGGWLAAHWLMVELGGHVAVQAPAPVAPLRDVGRSGAVHVGAAPRLVLALGPHLEIATDLSIALAGPLHGTYGFGIAVGYAFGAEP